LFLCITIYKEARKTVGGAYRAGLIHGIMHGEDWETTGRIASLLGAIKIE
jgi:sugar/nucleoside kinase (ribokinase family)